MKLEEETEWGGIRKKETKVGWIIYKVNNPYQYNQS
jgi:hypothetical protein